MSFSVDEGHYFAHKMVTRATKTVVALITRLLGNWTNACDDGERVTTSRGAFVLTPGKIRTPDAAFAAPEIERTLMYVSRCTCTGLLFAPAFVLEVGKLSGQYSSFAALDFKMRKAYVAHVVRLDWLIDPRPPLPPHDRVPSGF